MKPASLLVSIINHLRLWSFPTGTTPGCCFEFFGISYSPQGSSTAESTTRIQWHEWTVQSCHRFFDKRIFSTSVFVCWPCSLVVFLDCGDLLPSLSISSSSASTGDFWHNLSLVVCVQVFYVCCSVVRGCWRRKHCFMFPWIISWGLFRHRLFHSNSCHLAHIVLCSQGNANLFLITNWQRTRNQTSKFFSVITNS